MIAPDDQRHGTAAGYVAGCRSSACGCTWATARYEKQRTYERRHGKFRLVDNTGSRRRIRALGAIGWPMSAIAHEIGWKVPQALFRALDEGRLVRTSTASRIAAVYDRLSMQPGPSNSARIRATNKGWPPPLAWDDNTIDDPDAEPYTAKYDKELVDEVIVQLAMSGRPVKATKAERQEILRRWTNAGRPTHELERILPTANVWRDKREGKAA